jgi:rare lipoprotein A
MLCKVRARTGTRRDSDRRDHASYSPSVRTTTTRLLTTAANRCATAPVRRGRCGALVLLAILALGLDFETFTSPVLAEPSPSPARLSAALRAKSRLVRRLKRERAALIRELHSYRLQLDATRAAMAEMNLGLSQAESEYERVYVQYQVSLVAMYKFQDEFLWTALVEGLDPDVVAADYDLFLRIADQQRALVDEMNARMLSVADLQAGIADLKEARLARQGQIRERLGQIDAALKTGRLDVALARKQLQAALPRPTPPPRALPPAPGVGGILSGASHPPPGYAPTGVTFAGYASWYGPGFQGNHTANGEIYDMYAFTCASRTLPFGTWLRVTWQGRAVFVRVNDRGPVAPERVLDLSYATADALGMVTTGVAWVAAEIWR